MQAGSIKFKKILYTESKYILFFLKTEKYSRVIAGKTKFRLVCVAGHKVYNYV